MRAALAASMGAVLLVPLGITATTASWNDAEWVHEDALGTGTLDCAQNPALESRSRGTFLAGELLGIDLDSLAQLEDMRLTVQADGVAVPDPANAIDLGSTPPAYTFANPLDVTALGIAEVDLTGFTVALPGAALGAANQWAQGSTSGRAAGASGLINDSGAVLVSDSTPDDQLPQPATIDLTALLPTIAGLNAATLEVGAVAASSQLDGCAALREQVWGIAPAQPIVQRDYGIASLGLALDAPAVGALTGAVTTTGGQLEIAVAGLVGQNGLIAQNLRTALALRVPGIAAASMTGTVIISGLDLQSTVAPFLGLQLQGDGFTIDLANGRILVDVERLTGPLNGAAPNTELVLNAGIINAIVAEAGTLLDEWAVDVTDALRAAIRNAQVQIALSTTVSAVGYNLATVTLGLNSTIGAVVDGNATIGVTLSNQPTGLIVTTINTALGLAGLPTLSSILTTLTGSGSALTTAVANLLTTQLLDRVTTLGATLSTLSVPVVNVLAGVLNALPTVVSVMVNVQPDQQNAPPGYPFVAPTSRSTAEYAVTALRLGLADFAVPDDVAHVLFGTGSAGPVTLP
ncbi:cytochrome c, mono- and diheme variants [Microbacterium testaceum StLB037]|uniref:Cytochrome c, mono-and diheme variants n=1 Tax=Microbacterium testaceum (strain StLB037) TaxID=979556 RepID=E8NFG6_MICTS|nr:choice-of-anchor G family protein [Microbacterium testaceum]BAJ75239.1 cytochrome c, mono- and diheme variants [Microbacterium testaceum StLB037]